MNRCYQPEHTNKKYNPCGFSKIIVGEMMCMKDKKKLKSWGCLYACEYEKPPQLNLLGGAE